MSILTITRANDQHVAEVQKYLDEPIIVYDPSSLSGSMAITYQLDDVFRIVNGLGVNLDSVNSVWFRKPLYLEPKDLPVEDLYRAFAFESYLCTAKILYDLLDDRFWLSDFRNIMRSGNKILQSKVATSLGFLLPPLIITSNANHAEEFHSKHGNIVAKSLRFEPIQDGDQLKVFFTTRIRKDQSIDFSGLDLAPAILQKEVENKLDIRVTVVGDQVFACEILPIMSSADNVDWRVGIPTDELMYKEHFLPEPLRKMCIKLVHTLGLYYGAIDFALDAFSDYWFLEINPNGQWLFVEKATGQEIAKAIANLLVHRT